jgi:hypothetical protein
MLFGKQRLIQYFLITFCLVIQLIITVEIKAQTTSSIRSDGTILVNGEPFFPIGFYHVSWGSSASDLVRDMNIMADAGFNIMHASQTPSNNYGSFLDEANRRKVYIVTEFGEDRLKVVNQYKNKPAVFGWNIADDIDNGNTTREQVQERHNQLKSADPNHLTYVSGYKRTTQPAPNIGNYADIPDVVAMQSYPISVDILGAVYVTMANAVDAAKPYNRPIIGNVQSFKWYHSGARVPTAKEARNMTYQALAAGVKGIIYYTFYDSSNYLPNYTDAWNEYKTLVPEIKQLSPIFLNGKLTRVNTGIQSVYASYWEYQNKIYVIAVNVLSDQSRNITIKLPADAATQATAMFANRPNGLVVNNGSLTGTILAQDVHVYVLDKSTNGNTPAGTGLKGDYFDNRDFTSLKLTRTDPTINFTWGTGSPSSSIGADTFSARWTGQIEAPATGTYTFITRSDDGVRLWVNGQQLVNNWTNHSPTDNSGNIDLVAGQKYSIKLEYYENTGGAVSQLSWIYPGQTKQIIPQAYLYPISGIPNGTYKLTAKHSGRAATVIGWSTTDGGIVHQWEYVDAASQQWKIESVGDGYYRLTNVHSGKVMDVADRSTEDGASIHQWGYAGGTNQQWKIEPLGDGYYRIVARNSGKCADVSGGAAEDGANVIQWSCHGGDNQAWKLELVQ